MTKLLREKFPKIVNTKFTASMESSLDKVGEGQEDYIKTVSYTHLDVYKRQLLKYAIILSGAGIIYNRFL